MTIEHFLTIWNQHNTAIIEGLVGLIILMSLFLGYRSFFAKKSAGGELGAGGSLDTAQLEKTLQKILDAQGGSSKGRSGAHEESMSLDVDHMDEKSDKKSSVTADSGASSAEVEKLKSSVNESLKTIEALQEQLAEAQAQAMAAQPGSAGEAGAGMTSAEKDDFDAKIRDLESRLAEYEIISEDIADLSRYKDENENLKSELEALKAAGPAASSAAAPAATPVAAAPEIVAAAEPVAAVEAAVEPEPEPEPTPSAEPAVAAASPDDMIDAALAEAAAAMAPEPSTESVGSELIDDELMKEFAAAVEGQKVLDKVGDKAGSGKVAAEKKTDENDQLMNEFENFVAKKS